MSERSLDRQNFDRQNFDRKGFWITSPSATCRLGSGRARCSIGSLRKNEFARTGASCLLRLDLSRRSASESMLADILAGSWRVVRATQHSLIWVKMPAEIWHCLEHDPEKWKPVFRKDHAQSKK
jgi:hypothetical protein